MVKTLHHTESSLIIICKDIEIGSSIKLLTIAVGGVLTWEKFE